jgi:hypothetical protein
MKRGVCGNHCLLRILYTETQETVEDIACHLNPLNLDLF